MHTDTKGAVNATHPNRRWKNSNCSGVGTVVGRPTGLGLCAAGWLEGRGFGACDGRAVGTSGNKNCATHTSLPLSHPACSGGGRAPLMAPPVARTRSCRAIECSDPPLSPKRVIQNGPLPSEEETSATQRSLDAGDLLLPPMTTLPISGRIASA